PGRPPARAGRRTCPRGTGALNLAVAPGRIPAASRQTVVEETMREEKPQTEYQRFEGEGEFQTALDLLLQQPGRELRLFDPDLKALRLNSPARIAQLTAFLRASRTRKIYVVVHDTEHLTRHCPRMLGLLKLFTHAIQINRTH